MARPASTIDQKCSGVGMVLTTTVPHQKTRSGARHPERVEGCLRSDPREAFRHSESSSAILALTAQRHSVRGLTFGAVKG